MARPPSRSDAGLLAAYLRPEQAQLLVLGMVLVVAMLMPVAGPVLLGHAIDAALDGEPTSEIVRLAAAFLVVTVGSDALQVLVAYRSVGLAWRVGNRLRLDLARHALRLDLDWHGRHSAGLLIERIDGDVAAIVEFSSVAVLQLLGNAILVAGVLVVSFLIDWRAGLLILGSVTVASYLLIRLRSVAVPAHDAEREIQSELYGDLEERLGGLEDLRSLDAGEYVVHRLEHHSSRWWHAARRAALLGDGAYTAAATAFSVGSVLTLGAGVALQRNGVITLGALLAVFRFSQMVRQPIERIAEQMREFQKAAAGARRAARLLATVPTLPDGRGDHLPPGPLRVDLEDVAFAYAGDTDVLVDLDLHLAPGTRLGVVGRTGSGKSTLGRLLARLWDVTNGSVRLGGVDVRDAATDDLRRRGRGGEPGRGAAAGVAPRQPHLPRHRRRDRRRDARRPRRCGSRRVGGQPRRWPRHRARRRVGALRRPGPAAGLRPRPARRSRSRAARRGHQPARSRDRDPSRRGRRPGAPRPHRGDHRPPPRHPRPRGRGAGARARPRARARSSRCPGRRPDLRVRPAPGRVRRRHARCCHDCSSMPGWHLLRPRPPGWRGASRAASRSRT